MICLKNSKCFVVSCTKNPYWFKIMEKISAFLKDILNVVFRYYGVFLLALIATVSLYIFVGNELSNTRGEDEPYRKIAVVSLLGIALMFALHMTKEKFALKWPIELIGLIVPVGYFFLISSWDFDTFYPVFLIVLVVSTICFHLLVAFLPFVGALGRKSAQDEFWEYNKNLFQNLVQTAIFTLVLWGGLALATVAVEHLFNIRIYDVFWARLAILMLIMGSVVVFMLFAKDGFHALCSHNPYPVVVRFFAQYILIPLLIVYLVILYSYGAKILIEWNLPKGWVSYLVLVYSALGILSSLLLYPLFGENTQAKPWVRFFLKIFYFTLLPLLMLLFVAIGFRIAEYGFTENRYFVLVLALWLTGISIIQLINSQKHWIKIYPMSLFLIGIAALILPYFNVFSVSYASQEKELYKILSTENLLTTDNKIDFSQKINRTALNELADKAQYFEERKQSRRVEKLLPEGQVLSSYYDFYDLFSAVNEDGAGFAGKTHFSLISPSPIREGVFAVSQADYILAGMYLGDHHSWTSKDYYFTPDSLKLSFTGSHQVMLENPQSAGTLTHDYSAFIDSLVQQYGHASGPVSSRDTVEISTTFEMGGFEFTLYFDELNLSLPQADEWEDASENTPKPADYRAWGWMSVLIKEIPGSNR